MSTSKSGICSSYEPRPPLEQIKGQPTDERSDLYALGATVYALLTAQKPADAISRQNYINDGYPDPLKPVNQLNPRVPPHVAQALQRAMALDPAQRPHSAARMGAMLNAPPAKAPPLSSSRGNNTQAWLIFGATVATLLLFCGLLGIYMGGYGTQVGDDPPSSSATEVVVVAPTAVAQKDGMVQVYVSEGEFEMGSGEDDPDAEDDEKPRHTVYLDAFWIDRTEVTNGMFARFVQQTGHQTEAEKEGFGWAWDGREWKEVERADWQHPPGPESDLDDLDDHPVVQVTWNDATAYCEWAERRLPTEAEWEKAAGGGIPTEEGPRKYAWGNEPPTGERLNFCDQNCPFGHKDSSTDDGYEFTSPVGNYPAGASPYGAFDMAGNVWEWVEDNYDPTYYASSPEKNPPGPSSSDAKVLRGGSWENSAPNARVRYRNKFGANFRDEYFGFRCARSP